MRIGFIAGSYTARSTAIACEECINLHAESLGTQGSIVPSKSYGGQNALALKSYLRTPGLSVFTTFGSVPRGHIPANGRLFSVAGTQFVETSSAGVKTVWGAVVNDGNLASLAFNSVQVLIVSAGHAYCFTLATSAFVEVTASLAGTPAKVEYSDTYFIVSLVGNKYQMSQPLDGTTWLAQLVNEVSVFPENIRSIITNHRELWVFGYRHTQPYQNTGSAEVFDPIGGTLIEKGCVSPFAPCRADGSIFWVDEDDRGARTAWRSNGYNPVRVSTYAVETDLESYSLAQISALATYSYREAGHEFWVIYIPGSQWSWVYDIAEQLWHKRANWNSVNATWGPHWSWNQVNAFGKILVGDWNSNNLYQLSYANLTDNGTAIRWLRRAPTIGDEMERVFHEELNIDFQTGIGPQPPLTDGNGNPRQPQAMLRWSDDRGNTWSNEHLINLGFAGQYRVRARRLRLGWSRYRVYEVSGTDPVVIAIVDAYGKTAA